MQRLGRFAPRGAKSRLLFDNRILLRRPCESRDPYTVSYRLSTKAETFCPNERRWLWVPAFAGTTKEYRPRIRATRWPAMTDISIDAVSLVVSRLQFTQAAYKTSHF